MDVNSDIILVEFHANILEEASYSNVSFENIDVKHFLVSIVCVHCIYCQWLRNKYWRGPGEGYLKSCPLYLHRQDFIYSI